MVPRTLQAKLRSLARKYPIVKVTGPRQSGKTTLCRATFPRKRWVSFEDLDVREYATRDPRGFLADHASGAIFDEVQRVPGILSYLQTDTDERPVAGRFVLTGSANLQLMESVSQSLAGRTALLQLLPLSYDEELRFPNHRTDLFEVLLWGGYPAPFDGEIGPEDWFPSYVATYVERDVRQVLEVGDLLAFQSFLRLCAGRTGQLVNLSGLAADCGINHGTARSWLSVLEATYIVFRLPAFHSNANKRLVKTPKLYFYDAGLASHLLGIRTARHLHQHPLRGALFETWVVSEIVKARVHRGLSPSLYHYRDRKGREVDVVLERDGGLVAVEIKSARTIASDFFASLERFASGLGASERFAPVEPVLVYGGTVAQQRTRSRVLPWSTLHRHDWCRSGRP